MLLSTDPRMTAHLADALAPILTARERAVLVRPGKTPAAVLVPHPYGWTLCRDEVDVVFTVPLRLLDTPEAERRELWDFEGQQVPIEYYPVGEHVIWGATHRITRNLLVVLRTIA